MVRRGDESRDSEEEENTSSWQARINLLADDAKTASRDDGENAMDPRVVSNMFVKPSWPSAVKYVTHACGGFGRDCSFFTGLGSHMSMYGQEANLSAFAFE